MKPLPPPDQVTPADVSTPVLEPTAHQAEALGLTPSNGAPAPSPAAAPANPYDDLVDQVPEVNPYADLVDTAPPADTISVFPAGPESTPLQVPTTPEKADTYLADHYGAWLAHNQETDPARRVDVLRYSAATGIPADFLEPRLDEVKKELGTQSLAAALARRPALAKYLQDAAKAPLVKDDAAALGGLEWYLGKWDLMPQKVSLGASVAHAALGPLGFILQAKAEHERQPGAYESAIADATAQQLLTIPLETMHALGLESVYGFDDTSAQLAEDVLERRFGEKDYGAESWLNRHGLNALKMVPYLVGNVATRGAVAAAGAAAGAETGPGAFLTGAGGQYAGGVAYDFFTQAGPTFRNLRQLTDDAGEPLLSESEARGYALAATGASSLITGWLGGKLLGSLGAGELLERVGGGAIARALEKRTVAQAAKAAVKRIGTSAVEGALYSTVPAVTTATAAELAKGTHGMSLGEVGTHLEAALNADVAPSEEGKKARAAISTSIGNVAAAGGHAFAQGFQDMLLLGSIPAGRAFLGDMALAHRLDLGAKQLEGQVEAARRSKLAERSPGEFERFLSTAQGDEPQTVYADTPAWDVYWQGQKLDPRELAAQLLGDGGKAYDEAKVTGARLAIPAEKYLSKLARTMHHEGLRDDISLRPDVPTVNQGRKALDKKAQEVADAPRVADDGADQVHEQWKAMGVAAQHRPEVADAVGQLAAAAFRRLGQHFGLTAEEAYRKAGTFEIAGALGERRAAGLQPGQMESGSRAAARLSFLGTTERARIEKYFRDEITGLYNERGFAAAPLDPARPVEARFEINGGKPINDFHGHEALDGGLRMAAQTLRDSGILDGAKIGGDVRGRVQSEARAREIAAEMSRRLSEGLPGGQRIPVTAFTHKAGATKEEVESAYEAYQKFKTAETEAGRLGPRAGLPPGFLPPDAPPIDFLADPALGEKPREGFLASNTDEAKAALAKGAEGLKPVAERMLKAPMPEPAAITPAHLSAFEASLQEKDPFDTIHMGPDGELTGQGFKLVQEAAPKEAQLSGDIRGVKLMNAKQYFGKHATDQILSHVVRKLVEFGGQDVDVARPHGDELYAQANDHERLDTIFRKADSVLARQAFIAPTESGDGFVVQEGVRLAHAIARRSEGESAPDTLRRADSDLLPATKAEQRDLPGPRVELLAEEGGSAEDQLRGLEQALRGKGFEPVRLRREAQQVDQGRAGGAGNAPAGGEGPGGEGAAPLKVVLEKKGRGYLRVTGEKGSRRYSIRLGADADESTLAHEFSHAFGQVLADFAGEKNAPAALKEDYQALVQWMGYDSAEARAQEMEQHRALLAKKDRTSADEARLQAITAKEEKLSHGFEQYLAGGKPPVSGLARTFQRFRNWMLRAYRVANGPAAQYQGEFGRQLEFSPDVRRVFDRWFAADAAVTEATGPTDVFAELLAKATPEERAAFEEESRQAREASLSAVVRAVAQAQHEEVSGFVARERAKVREEVEAKLDTQPVYSALRFLQKGDTVLTPGETPEPLKGADGAPMKLDRKALLKQYSADFVRSLPRGIFAADKDRIHAASPDELAQAFDMPSGDALVKALQAAVPRERAIEAETQRLLEERLGPELLSDPGRLAELAAEAVHQEGDLRRTFRAIEMLRKQMGLKGQVLLTPESAAALAEKYVDRRTVGELTRGEQGLAGEYLRNERTAARRAAEAFRKGNSHAAETEMSTQLLNQAMYRRAAELRTKLEKGLEKLKASAKDDVRQKLGKADPDYLAAHDALLQAVGLRNPGGGAAPAGPLLPSDTGAAAAIDAFVRSAGGNAQDVGFDVEAIKELLTHPKRWKALTPSEAFNVLYASTNIRHAAREVNRILVLDRQVTMEEFVGELQRRSQGLPEAKQAPRDEATKKTLEAAAEYFKGMDASLLKAERLVAMMTKEDEGHPLHQLLVQGYLDARNKKAELGKQFLEGFLKRWDELPKELRDRRADLVDVSKELPLPKEVLLREGPVTRSNLWMMALNWGNDGNRQRLLDGFGWTEGQAEEVLFRELSTPEWKWVQSVWDSLEELYPLIEQLEREETGLPPDKVEATPIELPDGTQLRGGYFPAKYDKRVPSMVAARQAEGEIAKYFEPSYARTGTSHSHTKHRAAEVQEVVKLDWSVTPAHISQVLHDLAFRRWVKDAARVLENRDVQTTLQRYMGPEYARQLSPWLKAAANAQADSMSAHLSKFNKLFAGLRNRLTVQVLGHYLPIALGDFSNIPAAALTGEVHPKHVGTATLRMVSGGWREMRDQALALSPELRFRDEKIGRMFTEEMGRMGARKTGRMEKWRQSAFVFMELSDRYTATPIWAGRFNQALEAGRTTEEAVRDADATIRRLFPPESIGEMPAFTRDRRGLGALVIFHGYMNTVYNLERAWARELHLQWADAPGWMDKADPVARFAGKSAALALSVGVLGDLLTRGGTDDEDLVHFVFRKMVTFPFYLVPFLGVAVDTILFHRQASARAAPAVSVIERSAKAVGDFAHDQNEKALAGILSFLGLVANVPLRQEITTVRGAAHADGAADTAHDALYGPDRHQ